MIINTVKRPWKKDSNYGTRYQKPSSGFYHSSTWKNIRAAKLAKDPYCECDKCQGKKIKAEMVDHIKRIEDGGSPTDMSNLQSMTNNCHHRKCAFERNEQHKKK